MCEEEGKMLLEGDEGEKLKIVQKSVQCFRTTFVNLITRKHFTPFRLVQIG